jgi:hypothetical protein
MRPKLVVNNQDNGTVIEVFAPKPRLYMDYGVAKFLIWLFFFTGFFAGAVAIGMAWLLSS